MKRPTAVLAALVLIAGCSLLEDNTSERVIGEILTDSTMGPFLKTIIAPDSVNPDSTLTITINSFGSSSCTTPDGVDTIVTFTMVRVIPWDRVSSGARGCTADFASRPHPVNVQFPASGVLIIRAVGRVGPALDSIEHTVHIRP